MKKGAIKLDDEEEKKEQATWDPTKLAVGNWFSEKSYMNVELNDKGDYVEVEASS